MLITKERQTKAEMKQINVCARRLFKCTECFADVRSHEKDSSSEKEN
jgi:hypothetical protein